MEPRDASLLEKLSEMKAHCKAVAFGRRFKAKSHGERLSRFKKNGLSTRLDFEEEVKTCNVK